ncbi:molybdopterin molybdotransferase MoeA [Sphingomonas sp. So64.6b]|uniref:molybdopterin molybdotransferase MoeA n=1 Tax=Sphingomonas sp. So64.6b TaxID=2997354 RepID=UPI0016026D2B|nr:molybdopterin molybdotransferase MoeA [Sphingomonas sp. So64.6b]QNA85341.1 molybdopterin molybdotransferase MoeA [Sphingomonas sp. So64.6b]
MTERGDGARPGFDEARAIVTASTPSPVELIVPLSDALGRWTAADLFAARDCPGFDASAMDGFAFAAGATAAATAHVPVELVVAGEYRAGHSPTPAIAGAAYPISTGAKMPVGCDTVITTERASVVQQGERRVLTFAIPEAAGRNVRRQGEDARAGEPVLPSGRRITAETIGALASYGLSHVPVFRHPRISIIPTGDELVGTARPDAIPDANGPMIAASAASLGLPVQCHPPVGDDPGQIERAFRAVLASGSTDILISTGGVSTGDHDHIAAVLRAMGARIYFHGVRMRPGKPVLFAKLADGTLFFGLPGNPVASLLGFRFLVLAAVRTMLGRPPETGAPETVDVAGRENTTLFLRAHRGSSRGRPGIEILPGQQSHMMRSLLAANCWLSVDLDAAGNSLVRRYDLSATLE